MHICGLSNSFLMHYYHRCLDTSGTITLERLISRNAEVVDRFDRQGRLFFSPGPELSRRILSPLHKRRVVSQFLAPKPLKIVNVPAMARKTTDCLSDGGSGLTWPFSGLTHIHSQQLLLNTEQADHRHPPSVLLHQRLLIWMQRFIM